MGFVVLFALLFQSFDSFHHLAKQLSQKHCDHKYVTHKNDINHSHHDGEKCFVCEFNFSNYNALNYNYFELEKNIFFTEYSFSQSKEITSFFKGSLFAQRGPPIV